jgi:hypothetical protein
MAPHLQGCGPNTGMSNQIYKFIALGILIIAPIIAQVLSNVVPTLPQAMQTPNRVVDGPLQQAAYMPAKPANAPQPQPQATPSSNALVQTTPTLDTQGIAPTPVDAVEYTAAPPAPPPAPPVAEKRDDSVGPPPKRRPAYMDQ